MESFNQILKKQCDRKNSSLCIGLDVDNKKLKNTSIEYMKDYIFDIIDAIIKVINGLVVVTKTPPLPASPKSVPLKKHML